MSSVLKVTIPTFINPHLFWMVESKSDERAKTLSQLNKLMEDVFKHHVLEPNESFEVGDIVAVQIKKKYYRAIVEDIVSAEDTNILCFLCWLIDYGTMYESGIVYKLPGHIIRSSKPLALQASLNNVTYILQHLTYDTTGQAAKTDEAILTPTPRAHQVSLELMSDTYELQFEVENISDGILLGDILCKKENELKSLRQSLVDRKIIMVNEEQFQQIHENINSYKESHLMLIAQICKRLNSVSVLEEKDDNKSCQKLISKYLLEFEDRDLFHDEVVQPPSNRKSKSRNTTSNSDNSLNSGNDSVTDGELTKKCDVLRDKYKHISNVSTEDTSEPKMSRSKMLLEKLKRQRRSTDKNSDDDNIENGDKENEFVSPITSSKTPPSAKQKLYEYYKAKKLNSSIDKDKENSASPVHKETTASPNSHSYSEQSDIRNETTPSQPKKKCFPKNTIFQPGGASFTLKNVKSTSTPKSYNKSPPKFYRSPRNNIETYSDESSSDCKTKMVLEKSLKDTANPSEENSTSEESKPEVPQIPPESTERVGQLKIKPHCSCKQCDHWTNEVDWQTSLKFIDEPNKTKCLTVTKPQNLFREKVDGDRNIVALNFSTMTKLQKQATPKLLVHGEYSPTPVRNVSEANFHPDVHRSLHQLEYRETKRIQVYAWPATLRLQHVCMINGPQTGKTMGYLPVLLTFLLERNERYSSLLSKAGGPIFIILCANTRKCEDIYDLTKILLGRNRSKISLITYPLTHINTSHIDFLITTPRVLIDLLKTNATNFKRLCHLILEDGDKILKHNSEAMSKVLALMQDMLHNRVHSKPVQLIICGEHWNAPIENLLKSLSNTPLITIGNYLEAALYGKMQFSMRFVNSACKEQELKNLLKESHRICKSIILCKSNEIEEVQTILMLKGIEATVISEDLSKEHILYLEEVWTNCKGGEYTVLVCTDFLLHSLLTVTSASLLIHYSLPSSWTKFVKRFGCLLQNCSSPLNSKVAKVKCQSVVLCDEECEEHMSKFFRYIDVTELKHQLPDKFKKFTQDLKILEEEKKTENEINLCDTLKLFGRCTLFHCPRRHVVNKDLDVSKFIPDSGKVKFKIINIHDVTAYSIKLIAHIDLDNNIHECEDILDVTEDLTCTLKISRKRIVAPVVGHLYAYYDMDDLNGVYHRCELLEHDDECIKIKLIDKGSIISTVKARLFRLPKDFKDKTKSRKVIDAYLANCIPPYHDENFSAKSFFNLKHLLEKFDYKNLIMTGDIHLQLGNALWLKNVSQEVTLSDKTIAGFQLTREVLRLKLAESNGIQLASLYKLCNDASVALPTYEQQSTRIVKEEKKMEPQWAHLDTEQVSEVIFSAAISPDEIYFRLDKFNHLLYSLQKEIQEALKKPNYPKLQTVEVGTICLAKDPEGVEYCRVVIRNIENDKALCFFVDFGDEFVVDISELKHIYNRFISKLPFQTIQCRLQGIKPTLSEWQSDVTDILYEYAMEPNTDIFRSLFIKPCAKEENVLFPKQNRYSVLVKDGFGQKRILINNLLIDCGVAAPNSEEISEFDIPDSSCEINESEEELENIIDICRKTEEVEENFCPTKPESNLIDLENGDMELFVDNPFEFFEELLKSRKRLETSFNRELPAITAAPPVDYYTPEVLWSQTEKVVKIDIKLPDVSDYSLSLTKGRILNFKTIKNEKTYLLRLMLYEKVDFMQHTSMGPQIRATLTKAKDIDWPRLILSKQRARNIHYDVATINVKEDTRKILELPKMSDDEGESDDDSIDIMYHVVSDIDSDMDLEMPQDSD